MCLIKLICVNAFGEKKNHAYKITSTLLDWLSVIYQLEVEFMYSQLCLRQIHTSQIIT